MTLEYDDAVRGVYEGDNGVISSATPGSIVIEMSTVSPETSRELWKIGKARGVEVLDVAISGGPPLAENGTLTLLGGGSESAFENCAPIFRALAKQHFRLGPSGSASVSGLGATAAPCAAKTSILSRVRSKSRTLKPAAISRWAIRDPIAPRPIKPITELRAFMAHLSFNLESQLRMSFLPIVRRGMRTGWRRHEFGTNRVGDVGANDAIDFRYRIIAQRPAHDLVDGIELHGASRAH